MTFLISLTLFCADNAGWTQWSSWSTPTESGTGSEILVRLRECDSYLLQACGGSLEVYEFKKEQYKVYKHEDQGNLILFNCVFVEKHCKTLIINHQSRIGKKHFTHDVEVFSVIYSPYNKTTISIVGYYWCLYEFSSSLSSPVMTVIFVE